MLQTLEYSSDAIKILLNIRIWYIKQTQKHLFLKHLNTVCIFFIFNIAIYWGHTAFHSSVFVFSCHSFLSFLIHFFHFHFVSFPFLFPFAFVSVPLTASLTLLSSPFLCLMLSLSFPNTIIESKEKRQIPVKRKTVM